MKTEPYLVNYSNVNEFIDDIVGYVDDNYFGHFLFVRCVDRLFSKQEGIFQAFTIKREKNIEIIFAWTDHWHYVFGDHTSDESLEILIKAINIEEAKQTGLFGNMRIIEGINNLWNHQFNLVKHRLYYECSNPIHPKQIADGSIHIATISEQDEICKMGLEFYIEEFEGKGSKGDEEVYSGIERGISSGEVFCWVDNDIITSYIALIDNRESKIMIGSVFTKPEMRGKGYGKSLVYEFMMYHNKHEQNRFGFMVNFDNFQSIKMFTAVGFFKVYETGMYDSIEM